MKKNFKKAFSLLELSIVILIISILIAGSMTASVTAMNNAKYKVTRDRMNEIYKAIGNYLINNKALPCPASINKIKSSYSGYGLPTGAAGTCTVANEVYDNSTANGLTAGKMVYGMVPVQTLGLNTDMAEDGFGNKFTYVVAKALTSADEDTGFGGAVADGIISVKESVPSGTQLNSDNAVMVIISHGSNKFGAFNSNASVQNASSTDSDEQKNYGTGFSGTSVDLAENFISSAANSDTFDDVLFYKTRNMMLLDFNALFLVPCATATTSANCDNLTTPGECTWPKAYYNQIVSATQDCATGFVSTVSKPTRRCGAFGAWQSGTINPCTN